MVYLLCWDYCTIDFKCVQGKVKRQQNNEYEDLPSLGPRGVVPAKSFKETFAAIDQGLCCRALCEFSLRIHTEKK